MSESNLKPKHPNSIEGAAKIFANALLEAGVKQLNISLSEQNPRLEKFAKDIVNPVSDIEVVSDAGGFKVLNIDYTGDDFLLFAFAEAIASFEISFAIEFDLSATTRSPPTVFGIGFSSLTNLEWDSNSCAFR